MSRASPRLSARGVSRSKPWSVVQRCSCACAPCRFGGTGAKRARGDGERFAGFDERDSQMSVAARSECGARKQCDAKLREEAISQLLECRTGVGEQTPNVGEGIERTLGKRA